MAILEADADHAARLTDVLKRKRPNTLVALFRDFSRAAMFAGAGATHAVIVRNPHLMPGAEAIRRLRLVTHTPLILVSSLVIHAVDANDAGAAAFVPDDAIAALPDVVERLAEPTLARRRALCTDPWSLGPACELVEATTPLPRRSVA